MEYIGLNSGIQVPSICWGPGMLTRGMGEPKNIYQKISFKVQYKLREKEFLNAISSAIDAGYRFIDYSSAYGREDLIGKAIKESGVKRSEFVLTTRISNKAQFGGMVKADFYRSLERYGMDYVDVLMFHWPVKDRYVDTWRQMQELRQEGLCKILGVSNCNIHHLEHLITETGVVPSINQVEIHPLLTQKDLLAYASRKSIVLEAYTPLARMDERLFRLPKIRKMAQKYQKTMVQLILRWHIQNGVIPVFRSLNKQRLLENMDVFDFSLSDEDMGLIDSININSRLRYDPDNCDFTIL